MNKNTKKLAQSGVLLALGLLLATFVKLDAPWFYGGSITIASTLPIVFLAYKYGVPWGLLCGTVHGTLQLVTSNLKSLFGNKLDVVIICIILDYIIAFMVIGFSGCFRKIIKNPAAAIFAGSILGTSLRFVAHFISGFTIWGSYAEDGVSPYVYSFIYNIGYMGPEIIITALLGAALAAIPAISNQLLTEE